MTDCCQQVALTLEKVARIVRCLGQESMIGNEVLAEVPATTKPAAITAPKTRKTKAVAALPNPDKPRKKPGRKPKSESSGDATGPRGQGTTESTRGITVDKSKFGGVRAAIVAYLRRVGTADVAMICEGTGLERTSAKNALSYGMSQGVFITPQSGFWKVDPDYEG